MSATDTTQDVNGPEPDLNRVIGPKLLLLFIVGDILGAQAAPPTSPATDPVRA